MIGEIYALIKVSSRGLSLRRTGIDTWSAHIRLKSDRFE
jgi:hypothetical protein